MDGIDLTKRAWDVVLRAQEEARALGDPAVGTDHVLLAMLGDGRGAGASLLGDMGVDYLRVHRAVAGDEGELDEREAAGQAAGSPTD